MPGTLLKALCLTGMVMIVLDLFTVLYAARKGISRKSLGRLNRKGKKALGNWIYQSVWGWNRNGVLQGHGGGLDESFQRNLRSF